MTDIDYFISILSEDDKLMDFLKALYNALNDKEKEMFEKILNTIYNAGYDDGYMDCEEEYLV